MTDSGHLTEQRGWLCRLFGHRLVTRHHSIGFTTHCFRCLLSETVRRYS